MLLRGALLPVALLALLAADTVEALVTPVGTEFQVNTYTSSSQYQYGSAICHDGAGNFVIVWQSGYVLGGVIIGNQDGDSAGVFGQRYDSTGAPLGTEFQVNSYTTGEQDDPAVCCAANGNFVVVWSSDNYAQNPDQDGSGLGVFGQRFSSDGAFAGTEFQVNTYTIGFQYDASICCNAGGDFVVAWESGRLNGNQDGDYLGIFAQRFRSTGSPRGTEFQVNTYTTGYQFAPGICCDAIGNFVIVWTSTDYQDGDNSGVFGQRFAVNGSPRGTEFQINTTTLGYEGASFALENNAVCCDAAGDFTVAWESRESFLSYGDIFGQRFSSTGTARGIEFQVNAYTTSNQDLPAICCGPSGDFVIVWASYSQDGDNDGVFGRRFSSSGVPTGVEFLANTYTSTQQTLPQVSCAPTGNFVVSWTSFPDQDGDLAGVFARAFRQLEVATPTPTLSFAGLAGAIVVLLGAAARGFRRRR